MVYRPDKNKLEENTQKDKRDRRRLKILFLIAFLILFWTAAVKLASVYIKNNSEADWNSIASEKTSSEKKACLDIFNFFQNEALNTSVALNINPEFKRQLLKGDQRRLFEEIFRLNADNSYQIEVYNKRLELLAFKGRQIEPDYVSLQKVIAGNRFSVLKETGLYTYLIIYDPVTDPKDSTSTIGAILTAKLISSGAGTIAGYKGIKEEINERLNLASEIYPADIITGKIQLDSLKLNETDALSITGTDGKIIGSILVPKYDIITHNRNIDEFTEKVIAVLIFGFTIVLSLIVSRFILVINSAILRVFLVGAIILGIRYLWLEFGFPSLIAINNAEGAAAGIFSPSFYANSFGFGAAKSIGELLVSAALILPFAFYFAYTSFKASVIPIHRENKVYSGIKLLLTVTGFFFVMYILGYIIYSAVFDSNLRFFDKTTIIPSAELFYMQFVILIFSFECVMLLISCFALIRKYSADLWAFDQHFLKKIWIPVITGALVILNYISQFFINYDTGTLQRMLLILLIAALALYVNYTKSFNLRFFSFKNLSAVLLICVIFAPVALMDKLYQKETNYAELYGRKMAEEQSDQINFYISNELSNIIEEKTLETGLKDKSRISKLAYYIWSSSKTIDEKFNPALVVLDSTGNSISDFNINYSLLNKDSVITSVNQHFFSKGYKFNLKHEPDFDTGNDTLNTDTTETEDAVDEEPEYTEYQLPPSNVASGNPNLIDSRFFIWRDTVRNLYAGIAPIEKIELRGTKYARILGYVITAVPIGSGNPFSQQSLGLFKNFSGDNVLDKLISEPEVTEISQGEVKSYTDYDLSRAVLKAVAPFAESIKDKSDKTSWRYDLVNDETFRTFYIMSGSKSNPNTIYAISLKRDEFNLSFFFFLKYILFTIVIYLAASIVYLGFVIYRLRSIKLRFREKLFASFIIVSVIPIVILAIYTRSYIENKNNINYRNQIISDLNIVNESIKNRLKDFDTKVKRDTSAVKTGNLLTENLSQNDRVFNLYVNKKLSATTNDELYKSDLFDTRIDEEAYYNIILLKKDLFLKSEQQGEASTIVGYKPLTIGKNYSGVLSSQPFYRQSEINKELTETLTFIFGIYFIVVILLLVIVGILTEKISKPILELRRATERISQGQSAVVIHSDRKDEIGELVESFNKMTSDLEKSKLELKKAEREAAWRDIARRVAHEIKNPLTPMKLSIQHLYEMYHHVGSNGNFAKVLEKTNGLITSEIDKLNRIATEFSNFAKLPGKNYEPVNVNNIVEDVIALYVHEPMIEFRKKLGSVSEILGDQQELNRVFHNLIKNSLQAVGEKGIISVKTFQFEDSVILEIMDNGSGIDDEVMNKLFEPNFSTKQTGMGLGLSIVKKTLDDMKAEIKYTSKPGKGTLVRIKFKAAVESKVSV